MTIPHHKSIITVMIVDDSPVARELLRDILEECGYTVVGEAADGSEAVVKYRELQPMITFMDMQMPIMDGVEAAREIMSRDRDARILICSSSDRESLLSATADSGACGFIAKPITLEKVVAAIEGVFSTRSLSD